MAKLNTKNLIEEAWASYLALVVGKDATPEQVRQLKTAFYGGATIVVEVGKRVGEPDVHEDLGMAAFAGMDAEVTAFRRGTTAGGN